jgi:hypothetical protein
MTLPVAKIESGQPIPTRLRYLAMKTKLEVEEKLRDDTAIVPDTNG